MDEYISSLLKINKKKLDKCYDIFENYIYLNCPQEYINNNEYKIQFNDKKNLLFLLQNVEDKILYDTPSQKLYIYLILLYSNIKLEDFTIILDEEYMDTFFLVISKTTIIKEIFNLLKE